MIALAPATCLIALSACTLLVSTSDLAGSAEVPDSDASQVVSREAGAVRAPVGTSCRDIHARFADAGTGSYMLTRDGGGDVQAHCDMESFGGGWTLVTAAMIAEEKSVQEYAPDSAARVSVTHTTDTNGGISMTVTVTQQNCGVNSAKRGPGHYFTVAELDAYTQIMATYTFNGHYACWEIFGDSKLLDTNVLKFTAGLDQVGPVENISRDATGKAVAYDGRTTMCDDTRDNFWASAYAGERKNARVALRRLAPGMPAGLALQADCGDSGGGWRISDIRVR